ncbi:MAG: alpha/beta fold hydrolase [Steroidobacteraceae bacterium]
MLLLALPCARAAVQSMPLVLAGETTTVDVYAATGAHRDATVVIAHGFTRARHTMAGHARALADAGYAVVVPDLPFLMDSRDNARALRDLLGLIDRGGLGPLPRRYVMIGFSAGGLSALLASDAPGVVGYVGLDPFDRPGHVGLEAARRLQVPAYLLRGPSRACNAYSIAEPWAGALPQLREDRVLPGADHCDFESPTDGLCEFVCGDVHPVEQATVRAFILAAVEDAAGR